MRDIWITSDYHLNHDNILHFIDYNGNQTRPGFTSISEMNELILSNHNELVKPGDIVYNLGDVIMGDTRNFGSFWRLFNGRKRLIVGNHDDVKFLSSGNFFEKVMLWRMFPEFDLMLSHVPLHLSSLNRGKPMKQMFNVHGHIHSLDSPPGPYINVCVEKTNYKPVHIEDLAKRAKEYFKSIES